LGLQDRGDLSWLDLIEPALERLREIVAHIGDRASHRA
jgi:hypothetical protein